MPEAPEGLILDVLLDASPWFQRNGGCLGRSLTYSKLLGGENPRVLEKQISGDLLVASLVRAPRRTPEQYGRPPNNWKP